MPTPRDDQDVAKAEALDAWLRSQRLAPLTRRALLRDLAPLTGGGGSAGAEPQLRGLDPAAFVAELHRDGGGAVGRVDGISPRRIAGMRRTFPLRASAAQDAPPSAPEEGAGQERGAPDEAPDSSDAPDDALAALVAAADGLLVPSESDYPFAPFRWDGPGELTPDGLITQLGLPADTPVETRSVEAFFAPLARSADWMDDGQRAQSARFAELAALVGARLADARVYRLGTIRITTVVAGRDAGGATVGLRTTQIET